MTEQNKTSMVVPTLRYVDAREAIDWLCNAFGFREHLVVEHEGEIVHSELVHGDGAGAMIMVASHQPDNPFSAMMTPPDSLDGINTTSICMVVQDVRSHYEQAVAAGAKIELDLEDKEYGGSGYTCRDFAGHIWSVGDFDPREEQDG